MPTLVKSSFFKALWMAKGKFLSQQYFCNDHNTAISLTEFSDLLLIDKYSIGPPGVHREVQRSKGYFAYI